MPLGGHWPALLLARLAALEDSKRLGRQRLSWPPARPFHQYLQACCPGILLPKYGTAPPRCQRVLEHAPDAPPRAATLVIQPAPAVSPLPPPASLQPPRLAQCPREPHLGQGAGRCRPQCIAIEPPLPAFSGAFHWPTTPGQRHERLGGASRQRQRGTHQDPACHTEALRARHAFCLPLPTGVPGTLGWLHVHARGMDPARHLRLAARRAQYHWQGAPRCRFLAFQGGASCQWRARRGAQHDTEGIEPYEKRGPLMRAPHACLGTGHRRGRPRRHPLEPGGKACALHRWGHR